MNNKQSVNEAASKPNSDKFKQAISVYLDAKASTRSFIAFNKDVGKSAS